MSDTLKSWSIEKVTRLVSGLVKKNQGTANAGKALGINDQGQVVPVPFSGQDFTGATATSAGAHGYVPAPQITDMTRFLCGDGSWSEVAGGKLVTYELDEVTGTGGSYSHITYISSVTHDMKAVLIEVSDPDVFLDEISISCIDGGITFSCGNVNGTSTVTVSCLFTANSDNMTSSEFDVLSNRIGTIGNLKTTAKSNLVGAVNELFDDIAEAQEDLDALNGKIIGKYLPETLDLNDFFTTGFYNIGGTAPVNCPITWAQLIVNAANSARAGCSQILIHEDYIYVRRYTGNPANWLDWKKVFIYDQDWVTVQKDGDNSFFKYKVRGSTVTVMCRHHVTSKAIGTWENYILGNIPAKYRPTGEDAITTFMTDRNDGQGCALIIGTNGNVFIAGRWTGASNTGNILNATVTYTI